VPRPAAGNTAFLMTVLLRISLPSFTMRGIVSQETTAPV
jgi:hypothetical protein